MQVEQKLVAAFHAAFGVLMLLLLLFCAGAWQYHSLAAMGAAVALGVVLFLLLRRFGPLVDTLPAHRFALLFALAAAGFLLALLVLGNLLAEVLISDMGVVYNTIPEFLANGHPVQNNDYYIICNNNLGLALLLSLFYWFMSPFGIAPGTDAGLTAGICLNCLALFAAVLLLCAAARLITHKNSTALFFLLCSAAFAPLYLWAPYFYSDTLCMPFLSAAAVAYLLWLRRPRPALAVGMGVLIFLGWAVKGSLAVLLVAGILALLLEGVRRHGLRRAGLAAALLALSFALLWGSYQKWEQSYLDWSDQEAVCYPAELWFCYGSHDDGDYSQSDVDACQTQSTLAARQALLRTRIVENYSSRGAWETLRFLAHKAVLTWGDGEYGAAEYLAAPLRANFTAQFTIQGQPGYMPLIYYCQAWQYLLLALCGVGSLLAVRRRADGSFFVRLSLFGVMAFLSLWETKARYGLHFSLFLLLCGALALDALLPQKSAEPVREYAGAAD
jgi:hypothetical protein